LGVGLIVGTITTIIIYFCPPLALFYQILYAGISGILGGIIVGKKPLVIVNIHKWWLPNFKFTI